MEDGLISIFKRDRFAIYGIDDFICVHSIKMRSRNKSRRGRSGRMGGSTPPQNVEMPNVASMNVAPGHLDDIFAGAPALQLQQNVPQIHQVQGNHQFETVQRALNQNVQMVPAGQIGLAFNPPPHAPQGPIGGRPHKSRRHKTRRHKSHRRKSHRR